MKTNWIIPLLGIGAMLVGNPALAEEWLEIGRVDDSIVVCDADSMERSGDDWNLWAARCRYVGDISGAGGPDLDFVDFAAAAHCSQRVAFIYMGGEVEAITTTQGTLGGEIYHFLCRN